MFGTRFKKVEEVYTIFKQINPKLDDKKLRDGLEKINKVEMTKIINSSKKSENIDKKAYYEIILCIKRYFMNIYKNKNEFEMCCFNVAKQQEKLKGTNFPNLKGTNSSILKGTNSSILKGTKFGRSAVSDYIFISALSSLLYGLFNVVLSLLD